VRLPISEARRRLPELVRHIREDTGATVHITVHGEVVAELRAALPEPPPGGAAKALLALARRQRAVRRRTGQVSANVKAHLYGSREGGGR
jgi:antitoxin (DNA-binding transcriptional repressor) of toxin-antitoxin stability system